MARAFDDGMNSSTSRPTSGVNRTIERIWSIKLHSPSSYHPERRPPLRLFSGAGRIPNAVMIYEAAIDESFPVAEPPTQVARLRSGDPAALAEAVGHYQHRLYRYFMRLVRDPASADDLFQQTWLHVVRQLHRYDSARSFDTWLFAIAHNAAMDLLRRRPGERLEDHEFALAAPARRTLSARCWPESAPPSWRPPWPSCPRSIVRL